MKISFRRRQRALKVHELRQQGRSLRNIGKQLDISHATVLSDLKLIETHWSEVTQESADDFQLEQFSLLQRRLRALLQRDLLKEFGRITPQDFIRIYEAHNRELAILLRETRRLTDQLHRRAERRELEPGDLPPELDFPEEELVPAAKAAKSAKSAKSAESDKSTRSARSTRVPESTNAHHGLPKLTKPNHPNHPNPRKTRQFPPPTAPKKKSDQPADQPSGQPPAQLTPEQLNREAETFLRNYNGQESHTSAAR
ncbi:MAG: hypothetical protein OXS30_10935 [Chloroflexota bacterium]|nr:hypothetical protein [Chloroflexota bacterium]